MKKLTAPLFAVLIAGASLTGCGTTEDTTALLNQPADQIQAQAAKKITVSLDKKESTEVKKVVVEKPIPDKKDSTEVKKAEKLDLKFSAPVGTNDYDSRQYARQAQYALSDMNRAFSYSEGYRIGLRALETMRRDGVYVARVAYAGAEATKDWDNGYKVVASALNHIAADRENTPAEAVRLVLTMMSSNDSWQDGYRVGSASLRVIGTTDNREVRYIVDEALRRAERAYDYKQAYDEVRYGLDELRRIF